MATQPPPRKGTYYKHIQVLHKDQHRSLQSKHSQEMLLLDSIKGFFKQRFALEKQHFEALSKICSSQYRAFDCIKKLPVKDPESNEVRHLSYTTGKKNWVPISGTHILAVLAGLWLFWISWQHILKLPLHFPKETDKSKKNKLACFRTSIVLRFLLEK